MHIRNRAQELEDTPDHPHSLFEGLAGFGAFCLDCLLETREGGRVAAGRRRGDAGAEADTSCGKEEGAAYFPGCELPPRPRTAVQG